LTWVDNDLYFVRLSSYRPGLHTYLFSPTMIRQG